MPGKIYRKVISSGLIRISRYLNRQGARLLAHSRLVAQMNRTEAIERAVTTYRNFALHNSASVRDVRAAIRTALQHGAMPGTIQRAICHSGESFSRAKTFTWGDE